MRSVFMRRAELFDTSRPFYIDASDMSFRAGAGRIRLDDDGLFVVDNGGTPKPVLTAISATTASVNSETLAVGDVMIGDNSSGKSNLLFDQSAGNLKFRIGSSSTPIVFDPTNGLTIYGGTGFATTTAINFLNSGGTARIGEVYGYTSSSTPVLALRCRSDSSSLAANAYVFAGVEHASGGEGRAYTWANSRIENNGDGTYTLYSPRGYFWAEAETATDRVDIYIDAISGDETAYIRITADDADRDINISSDDITFTGTKSGFHIDHPLHPLTMTLSHTPVEAPEHLTFYAGTATLDDNGEAVVTMPEWFGPLNKDVRYMLTCVDEFAPVYVKRLPADGPLERYAEHTFAIAGGKPGQRIDWHVTGLRDDPFARKKPFRVERDKKPRDVGSLIHWKQRGNRRQFREKLPNVAPSGYRIAEGK